MYPNKSQFGALGSGTPKISINKGVKKNYPQLMEQLNLQLKQEKVNEHSCYPWQLNCKNDPTHP
jgi:hypothetical protein